MRSIVGEAEKERIISILAIQSPGFDSIINAAIMDREATAETTALKILKEQKNRGISLDEIKKDSTSVSHVPLTNEENAEAASEREKIISFIVAGADGRS